MKKLLSTLLLFASIYAFGQTVPQGINYQAVALDQNGEPLPGIDIAGRPIDDAEIGVRLTILENSPTGIMLYQEEHEVLTDLYGMFNLVIGQGLQVSPDPFSSIDWISDKYLQVELSIENNGSFTLSAVQQLMSVPYAFLAENAMVAQTAIDVDDSDADPTNEIQGLSLSNDTLYLSNGGFVVLPTDQVNDADDDPTNELQGLSISNDTIYLFNGGFVTLPTDQVNDADDDPTNELQVISIANDSIELSNGGKISIYDVGADYTIRSGTTGGGTGWIVSLERNGVIQADFFRVSAGAGIALSGNNSTDYTITSLSNDMDSTNEIQTLSLIGDTLTLSNGGSVVLSNSGGASAIDDLTDGITVGQSVGLGDSTLANNTTGISNVAVGWEAMKSNTTGIQNTAVGRIALKNNKTGTNNTAIGEGALTQLELYNTTSNNNTALGNAALYRLWEGNNNISVGSSTGAYIRKGSNNVFVGGVSATSQYTYPNYSPVDNNTIIGAFAGQYLDSGASANVFVGRSSGYNNRGSNNTAVGSYSLDANTTGGGNVAVGDGALTNNTVGSYNIGIGKNALNDNTSASSNVAIGRHAMLRTTTGNSNVAVGLDAFSQNETGAGAVAIGVAALQFSKGGYNSALGQESMKPLRSGTHNVAIGAKSGYNLKVGSQNVLLGALTSSLDTAMFNTIAIGYQVQAKESNRIYIGNSNHTALETPARVIGKNGAVFNDSTSTGGSTALEVNSNTKGFLPPRMTHQERDNIQNPEAGLIVYCINCDYNGQLQVFNGFTWRDMVGNPAAGIPSVAMGDTAFGGVVAYLFQQGDTGYVAGEQHGIIVSVEDFMGRQTWGSGFSGSQDLSNLSSAVGMGRRNTDTILKVAQTTGTFPATNTAIAYGKAGYSDWFLPSNGDLLAIKSNLTNSGITNFNTTGTAPGSTTRYWSSSIMSNFVGALAPSFNPTTGVCGCAFFESYNIRPVRYF